MFWIYGSIAAAFLFAALAGWAAWQIAGLSSRLKTHGETTVGTISNKRILGDNLGARGGQIPHSIDFNIYYTFTTPKGRINAISDVLHQDAYDRYRIGQKVKVRYLPDQPEFNEIIAGRTNSGNAWAAGGMAIFFAALGFAGIFLVRNRSF